MEKLSECFAPPSEKLLQAVDEFNQGEWYECHKKLEELWIDAEGEMRHFYQGILQIAVALHHWRKSNFNGAVSLLGKGSDNLLQVRSVCQCIEVQTIIADAFNLKAALIALGPERMTEIDHSLIPLARLTSGERVKT